MKDLYIANFALAFTDMLIRGYNIHVEGNQVRLRTQQTLCFSIIELLAGNPHFLSARIVETREYTCIYYQKKRDCDCVFSFSEKMTLPKFLLASKTSKLDVEVNEVLLGKAYLKRPRLSKTVWMLLLVNNSRITAHKS